MTTMDIKFRATTQADARAAAIQAIDEMAECGFTFARMDAYRDGTQFEIYVSYRKEAAR